MLTRIQNSRMSYMFEKERAFIPWGKCIYNMGYSTKYIPYVEEI